MIASRDAGIRWRHNRAELTKLKRRKELDCVEESDGDVEEEL